MFIAVKEARLKELKQEVVNSKKLQAYFEDNPTELQLLRHDSTLRPKRVQPHLAHVPEYLIPAALKPAAHAPQYHNANGNMKKGKKRSSSGVGGNSAKKRKTEDPLQSFSFTVETLGREGRANAEAKPEKPKVAHPSDTGSFLFSFYFHCLSFLSLFLFRLFYSC